MEYLYTLYILSGIIKGFLNYFEITFELDFTLLTGVVLIITFLFHMIRKKEPRFDSGLLSVVYLFLMFFTWMNVSIVYSLSPGYSYEKSFLFLTNVLAFVIPIFHKQFNITKFLKMFTIVSTVLGVFFLMIYSRTATLSTEAAKGFSGLYLSIPEICSISVLIFIIFDKPFSGRIRWALAIVNSLIVMLGGGRGPIVFAGAVLIAYVTVVYLSGRGKEGRYSFSMVRRPVILMMAASVCLFLVYGYMTDAEFLLDRSITRLMSLYNALQTGTEDASFAARVDHIIFSVNLIFADAGRLFFGYGLGSYGVLYAGFDERAYPHNILLEVFVETGFIGLMIFCGFVARACWGHLTNNPFVWILIYMGLNLMKSSSLVDLRLVFGFLAIMVMYAKAAPMDVNR